MDISIVLMRVLGILLFVIGVDMLFDPRHISAMVAEIAESRAFMWVWGFIALMLGAFVVAMEESWSSGWQGLLTVIGWLILLKGVLIMLFPRVMASWYRVLNKAGIFVAAGVVAMIVGALLLYVGFFA